MRPIPTAAWLWPLLAVPAVPMTLRLLEASTRADYRAVLFPSGEFAARFLIIAMLATPLTLLLRGWRGPRWLMRHRRAFGVASFAYAALHLVVYLVSRGDVHRWISDLDRGMILTGWLAFAIMLPLAVTSNDWSLRRLGPRWKAVQRWTYPLALLTLWHWASVHDWGGWLPASVHFAPLALLTVYRLWWNRRHAQRGPTRPAAVGLA